MTQDEHLTQQEAETAANYPARTRVIARNVAGNQVTGRVTGTGSASLRGGGYTALVEIRTDAGDDIAVRPEDVVRSSGSGATTTGQRDAIQGIAAQGGRIGTWLLAWSDAGVHGQYMASLEKKGLITRQDADTFVLTGEGDRIARIVGP